MSLVDGLRRDASTKRDHELRSISSSHRGLLRGLWSVNTLIHNNLNLASLINHARDSEAITDDEAIFLKKNDLSNGLLFDPASLPPLPPTTAPQHVDAPIYASKPSSTSTELIQQVEKSENVDATAEDGVAAAVAAQLDPTGSKSTVATQPTTPNAAQDDAKAPRSASTTHNAPDQPDGPDVPPVDVAPPLPEDEADLTASEQQYVDQQEPSKPAKVVHLPPEDVQEAKLREREAEEERRRQSDAESKSSQHLAAPQTEIASSPSSTVGPYSAATPVPPQDSPDTSPDSESAQVEVLPPKEVRPSDEEQRQKEEHDRLLEAQKEIAKREALGDVDQTPDEQLQWEAREAAAREAEEQAAREEVGGPEPASKDARDSTEAEQVVESMQVDDETEAQAVSIPAQDEKHVKTPAAEEVEGVDRETKTKGDDDTVDVASRSNRTPHPIDTTVQTESPGEPSTASARPERMTTRVSSGVLRQKSVSEILGQSQSPPTNDQFDSSKAAMSPEPISPLTQRNPNDNANITQATPISTARQTPRSLQQHRLSTVSRPSLEQLDTLKGAADDPNKDYLEPLFRIQAHEAPNSNTKTLPELVRTGTKALSTDDHFTALHERLDFRMLRRIYQLQNANKWSLRQMEKCREPEQPVTLHDHMMEEMKWMRKDFKAERKMKKNVCAFLAQKCSEWVASGPEERKLLQVKVNATEPKATEDAADAVPELEQAGDSAAEDDMAPRTPRDTSPLPATVVIAPDLAETVQELRKSGKLAKAVTTLPIVGLRQEQDPKSTRTPVTLVSKFIEGKVLPKSANPTLKRSRFEYEDEAEALEAEPDSKRLREEQILAPENVECALFQDESKPIRERLHSNNAFRPPSEFIMPSTPFYEFRNGSQWIQDDDQKLRKLAKEYSFNWSLIADEMALPTRFKSSAERRTPWECFERWVELESLPADMRKTVYFKTWFQRLEQSQQAAERRYLQQVAHLQQAAAASGAPAHVPPRRRTIPTRVEKRKSSRYLWMIDGFRKLAKKREQQQWKQAETARAAAQRKSQTETNPVKMVKMTPQEFSKKRQERDEQMKAAQLQYLQKQREAAQRQSLMARQAQQGGLPNGAQPQQRPPGANQQGQQPQVQQPQPNGQPNVNGQAPPQQPQARQAVAVAPQRNGHLAPPQVNGQGMPQAQMQARPGMPQQNMQQMAQANAQGRNNQFPNQQQYPMPNGNMPSPGGNMTTAQQLQQNQALLAAFHQQQSGNNQGQNMTQNGTNQQMSASPSMPPPPTPHGGTPQQLSSGHVPQIIAITNQLRISNPGLSDDQLKAMATQQMKAQSQSSSQTRQSAMNAAAGIPNQSQMPQQQYAHNQNAYQRNGQMPGGMNGMYPNGDGNMQQANMSPANSSPSQQQVYAHKLWQRQQLQMQQTQSPNAQHAQLNGSPSVSHASPSMTPASPSMQYSNTTPMGGMGTPMANGMNGQRPPSRSNTPQMQRLGSSGSGVPTMGSGMQSPGSQMQGSSTRNMQASMAR
ncbi:hypothetical protein M409DRAFT_23224 [Zasmidium cellare ATCC 36951]|uniref:Vacuolar import and degradation protein 21 n=1 Tax=Zasmidium cellare ATCC 36951 TaxID=1080233 RepID=A0A6A6CKA8_ZASCE|nr:uncharacterized protein M409DRAFT_23224 [Zasmidium cellare ATCC 36951]KAF2166590.1 hypothetical protein M409DRAFT_23224 [Zasmidium cellare ATCC 36951]